MVTSATLHIRQGGTIYRTFVSDQSDGLVWTLTAATINGRSTSLSLDPPSGYDYYVELHDTFANQLRVFGSAEKPLHVSLQSPASQPMTQQRRVTHSGPTTGPFYRRWWFWTATAAVVAGSVTAIALAATSGDTTRAVVQVDAPPQPRIRQ